MTYIVHQRLVEVFISTVHHNIFDQNAILNAGVFVLFFLENDEVDRGDVLLRWLSPPFAPAVTNPRARLSRGLR